MKQATRKLMILVVISVAMIGVFIATNHFMKKNKKYSIINNPSISDSVIWVVVKDGSEENLIDVIQELKGEAGTSQILFFSEMPTSRTMPLSPSDQDKIIGGFVPGGGEKKK